MLLTCTIQTVETDLALYCRCWNVLQCQRLQYVAVIWLLRYHVTLYYLNTKHIRQLMFCRS